MTITGFHGGKTAQAPLIHELAAPYKRTKEFPQGWHHRVIAFAGGLGESLSWECEGVSEVFNDCDNRLLDLYKVIQNEEKFERFRRLVELAPVSQRLWEEADEFFKMRPCHRPKGLDDCQRAYYFFVLVRQSMSKRAKGFHPLSKSRLRRGMSEQVSSWLSSVEGLPEAHERLRRVVLLCGDALEVCKKEDHQNSLFYLDPPFVQSTRTAPEVYENEMSDAEHSALLNWAVKAKGWAMISGYACELYDDCLSGWRRHDFEVAIHSGKSPQKRKRTESIWVNFDLKRGAIDAQ